jgi:hypothetical protein
LCHLYFHTTVLIQQTTDIHPPCGIRTHNPSKRTAADPRLIPRGHWDWRDSKCGVSGRSVVSIPTRLLRLLSSMWDLDLCMLFRRTWGFTYRRLGF